MKEISVAVAAAVEEQNAATTEISRSTQETATSTRSMASSMEKVNDATSQCGQEARSVLIIAKELTREAEDLRQEIKKFCADAVSV